MSDPKSEQRQEVITTKIWNEVPEKDNSFAAAACYCSGYDVYGDLLGKISWIEYLYLLFKLEPPAQQQARLLEALAIAIANPGPRDHSVRAAMNSGVGGSTKASALMAALAVGAGYLGGAREVYHAMECWRLCGFEKAQWLEHISNLPQIGVDVWLEIEHFPGFDPHGVECATPVKQTLKHLSGCVQGGALSWVQENRSELESAVGYPLAMSGVAAAAFFDLALSSDQAEMLYLMLRLPGAAAHSLEQHDLGWRRYPFFQKGLVMKEYVE